MKYTGECPACFKKVEIDVKEGPLKDEHICEHCNSTLRIASVRGDKITYFKLIAKGVSLKSNPHKLGINSPKQFRILKKVIKNGEHDSNFFI